MLVTTKVPFGLVLLIKSKIYDEEIKSFWSRIISGVLPRRLCHQVFIALKKKKKKSGVDERQDKLFLTSCSSGGSS